MDYRAVAELIWFALLGLSVFVAATGLSIRIFIAPVVREIIAALGQGRSGDQARADARIELLEARLLDVESEAHRWAAVEDFQRELRAPRGPEGRREPTEGDDPEA